MRWILSLMMFVASCSTSSDPDAVTARPQSVPSPTAKPRAIRYASADELADALGQLCSERRPLPPEDGIEAFLVCYDPAGAEIELWMFGKRADKKRWLTALENQVPVIVGPNWIVTPNMEPLAMRALSAVGGRMIRP